MGKTFGLSVFAFLLDGADSAKQKKLTATTSITAFGAKHLPEAPKSKSPLKLKSRPKHEA